MPGAVVASTIEVDLYSPAGVFIASLPDRLEASYQERSGESGGGTFTLLETDPAAALVTERCIVKYKLFDQVQFGARVGKEVANYPENLGRVQWQCIGLLGALLNDGYVLPASGSIRQKHTGERWFGWMDESFDDSSWTPVSAANATAWTDTVNLSNSRLGYPIVWPATGAWWMEGNAFNSAQLFTATLTLPADAVVKFYFTSDEGGIVYVDGEKLIDVKHDETGYTQIDTYPEDPGGIAMAAGSYQVAIEMHVKATPITGDGMDACMFAAYTLDINGEPDQLLLQSDVSSGWRYYSQPTADPRPGLPRAAIIRTLVEEAAARGVQGCSLVNFGFSSGLDSAQQPWTDQTTMALPIALDNLDEIAFTLAEDVIDLSFDAVTMTLHAWKRRGSDKSGGATPVRLQRAENITSLQTSRELQVVTAMTGVLADGTFVSRTSAAGLAAHGRVERGVTLGASSPGTGQAQLDTLLGRLATPEDTIDVGVALYGALPYTDYSVGDTIRGPAHRTGETNVRVLALSVTMAEGSDWAVVDPELVVDPTGAGA